MRLDVQNLQTLFNALEQGKKVTRLSVTQEQLYNLGHTINVINSLPLGRGVIGDGELLSDYQIPSSWSELIQPATIKFSSDEMAVDYKNREAYTAPIVVSGNTYDKVLSSTEFKLLWNSIVGSYEKTSPNFVSVQSLRKESTLAEVGKHAIIAGAEYCINDGLYVPSIITIKTYDDMAYNVDCHKMFEKWLVRLIIA